MTLYDKRSTKALIKTLFIYLPHKTVFSMISCQQKRIIPKNIFIFLFRRALKGLDTIKKRVAKIDNIQKWSIRPLMIKWEG